MRSRPRMLAPLPCAIVLAAFIAIAGIGRGPAPLPPGATADDTSDDRVTGTVGGPVVVTPRGFGAPLHAEHVTVWIWSLERVEPGERIAVSGRLRKPRGFLGPGSPDRGIVTASRGAQWELSATHVERITNEPGWVASTWRWAARVQRSLSAQIQGPGGEPAARAALDGIVTGDRTRIPAQLDARWRAVGIYHVLSVSGLHLAVIAGLAFALLRRLFAASPLGGRSRPARWAAPAAILLAIAYTLITGAQLATLRALIVVTIVLVAQMLDRPVRLVDALGLAAIAILVWRPQDLHDPSFQLSFVAALTLALIPPRDAQPVVSLCTRVWRWLGRGLATSAWVVVTTAPITALHFHQVAAGGVIGNLVLTPLVELAALPLGLAGALLGALTGLGATFIDIAVWIVACVDDVSAVLAHAMPVGSIAIESPLLAGALVTLGLWSCHRRERTRSELVVWIALCAAWAAAPVAAAPGALRVTFLDVGQGDAAIIELPGGEVWLVDAGGIASSHDLAAASRPGEAIERALAVYGHDRIDLAILSHPHPDHYLGLARIRLPITELWFAADPAAPDVSPMSFTRMTSELARRGTRLVRPPLGSRTTEAGVTLTVWAPRYAAAAGTREVLAPDPVRTVNDNSLVVTVEYAGRTILFAGDLEAEGEEALVAAGVPTVDVVKVAHHGSRTSSSATFVAATRPSLAVISCGLANTFGFPADEVLARWRRAGAAIARTDLDGAVTVTIDQAGDLSVERYAHPRP